jgi:hypothetical protein
MTTRMKMEAGPRVHDAFALHRRRGIYHRSTMEKTTTMMRVAVLLLLLLLRVVPTPPAEQSAALLSWSWVVHRLIVCLD